MPTQIRNIVPRSRSFQVGTNEDWIDGFPFFVVSDVAEDADPGNKGDGTIGTATASPTTPYGLYRVTVTDIENGAAFFSFAKRENSGDQVLARGVVGQPIEANGIRLTLVAGATAFAVGDGFSLTTVHALQDVTGIAFHLHLRRNLGTGYPATPVVFASTDAVTILNGGVLGVVNMNVPRTAMQTVEPRTYDYDLLAVADGLERRVYFGTVEVVDGVTRIAT